ncbi:ribonuclease H2 subunit A isoform X2 [Anabrus simplex]
MVYGVSYCPLSKVDVFKDLGCADSKSLTETKREDIFENIFKYSDSIGWMVEAIAANTICNNMLRRQKYTLNQLAQDSTVNLIKKVLEQRVYIAEVYVDTVGPPEKYQERLSQIFPDLKITVAKKADATYPVVSAASICAKVCRDTALKVWAFREGLALTAEEFGSGYPNDPVTKKFLLENMDPVFGFPQLVRFSWSTASRLLEDNAVNVEWEDIEEDAPAESPRASLLPFLKRIPSSSGKENRTKHPFFTERNLKSTVTL